MKKQMILALAGLLLTTSLSGCSLFKRSFNWVSNGFSSTPTPDPNQPNNNYPYYYSAAAAPIDANERTAYSSPYASPLPPAAPGAIQAPSYNYAQPVTGGYASGGYGVNPTDKTARVISNTSGTYGGYSSTPAALPPYAAQQPMNNQINNQMAKPELPIIAPAYPAPQPSMPAMPPAPQAQQPHPQTLMTYEQWQQLQQQGQLQQRTVGQYQYPPAR